MVEATPERDKDVTGLSSKLVPEVTPAREVLLYVGPPGGSDERGAAGFTRSTIEERLPLDSLEQVIRTVDGTQGTLGSVVLEDSLHGEFTNSLVDLVRLAGRAILVDSYVLEEQLFVVARHGAATPTTVISHPAILEQAATQLRALSIGPRAAATTAAACALVAAGPNDIAALAPLGIAANHDLVPVAALTDLSVAVRTRFGLLGHSVPSQTGSDHTLLMLWPEEDRPGTLGTILATLAGNGVNLLRLASHSFGPALPHGFYVELVGHLRSEAVTRSIRDLLELGVRVRLIGVVPEGEPVQAVLDTPPLNSLNNAALLFGESP